MDSDEEDEFDFADSDSDMDVEKVPPPPANRSRHAARGTTKKTYVDDSLLDSDGSDSDFY